MFRKISATLGAIFLVCAASVAVRAATLSPTLQSRLAGAADTVSVGTVIVTFNTTNGLNESHLSVLRGAGITRGYKMQQLGMVATNATAGQVRALVSNGAVRSV